MTSGPRRIVSLVPSETYNVARLGALARLIGRTRYCISPARAASIPIVGGTKDVDVDNVIALNPDLVLANREENGEKDVQRLIDAGLNVRVVFPRTVDEGLKDLESLAELLQATDPLLEASRSLRNRGPIDTRDRLRCFVPIWRNPWMTINDDTYIGDVLRWLGFTNVFGDRPSTDDGKDTRYPRVTFEEVREAKPDVVLLPNEPYRFGPKHVALFEPVGVPTARVVCVDGRDLCWHGAWAIEGLARLEGLVETWVARPSKPPMA